ncbi:hypothetical protein QBC44DRAFT_19765 [Cladorrhinum sp. PSN332]|nr:hypothetical protein QBC44DRAFT_19765 [Cladorrhinum sp. PSN332]
MCSIGFFNHLNNANSDAEYMLEFRMSYLANVRDPMFPQKVDSKTGLVLQRQRAKAGEFYFETRLASLCLYKSKKGYRIIALTDDNLWDKDIPSKLKLSETRGRAVPCFHAVAVGLFMHMERECMNLLNRIDNSLHEGFQLEDTLDPKKLDHSMFDPTLTKSKFYFSTLLILRKSKGLLDRTARTWSALQGKLRDHPQFDYDQNRETWGITTKQLEKLVKGIQERIESKEKEITDLRDCLYNATSLREAVDGMAINKAIYLFTIITVIFAPLSFMTSLWALPFLNEPAPGDGKKVPLPSSFKQTMVVVPLSIMLICAAVLVWTWLGAEGRTKWKRNVIARLEGMKHSSRQENALKQMLKEKDGDLESGIPK